MASLQASLVGPSPSCTAFRKTSASRSPAPTPAFRRFAVPVAFRRSAGRTHSQRRQLQIVRADKTSVDTSSAKAVTNDTWEELVLKAKVPVLVDFWAPWCGPCRMLAPIIDELANEYGDKLVALKLNTDESPAIATEYGIRSIPTVMIFKNGQKLDTVIGAVPKNVLSATLDKYVD